MDLPLGVVWAINQCMEIAFKNFSYRVVVINTHWMIEGVMNIIVGWMDEILGASMIVVSPDDSL